MFSNKPQRKNGLKQVDNFFVYFVKNINKKQITLVIITLSKVLIVSVDLPELIIMVFINLGEDSSQIELCQFLDFVGEQLKIFVNLISASSLLAEKKYQKLRIFRMSTNSCFEENQIINHEINLVFEDDKRSNKNAKDKICQFTPLIKMPNYEKIFFIYGDILINLDEDNEQFFFDQLKFHNSVRPIKTIKREKESLFMRIEFNNEKQGQIDINPLISMMQTMQNQEYYYLSKNLEQYECQLKMQLQQQYNTSSDPLLTRQRKNTLRFFKEFTIPQILKQEQLENPLEVQSYGLLEFFDSIYDSRMGEFGHNQNFLHLIGTDLETIEQFYLREGWFSAFYNNNMAKQYLQKVIEQFYYKINNNLERYQLYDSMYFQFKTLDQVDIYGLLKAKTYFVYQNSQYLYTDNVDLENINNLIGIFSILTIDISPEQIQKLMEKRQNFDQFNQNHILSQCDEISLSKFEYEIQSQFMINKYYEQGKMGQKSLLKTCKFKCIQSANQNQNQN